MQIRADNFLKEKKLKASQNLSLKNKAKKIPKIRIKSKFQVNKKNQG
jgi:hypothetical protein